MADRAYIPSSPKCAQWETLLADALDGQLRPEEEAGFTGHMAICPGCAALFEEARRGREWLEFLAPEPQIPEGLLDRILAQTGPGQVAGYGRIAEESAVVAMPPAWQQPGFAGQMRRYAEPRMLKTMAMAFFSIALTLNLVGFKFSEVRISDLRPSAVRSLLTRRIVTASIPFLRYYDHLRFLYQVETSMRQAAPSEGQSEPAPKPAAPISATPGLGQKDTQLSPYMTAAKRNSRPLHQAALKSTGFSPYITEAKSAWASAPEGFTPQPMRMLRLFAAVSTGRSVAWLAHPGGSTTTASKRSSSWTA